MSRWRRYESALSKRATEPEMSRFEGKVDDAYLYQTKTLNNIFGSDEMDSKFVDSRRQAPYCNRKGPNVMTGVGRVRPPERDREGK